MLRACKRLLKRGGSIGFFSIFIASGLSPADYRRAARSGPPAVRSRNLTPSELLEAAGFTSIAEQDLTSEFLETTRAWLRERQQNSDELIALQGEAVFLERQADSEAQAHAVEEGLLGRGLFVAKRL